MLLCVILIAGVYFHSLSVSLCVKKIDCFHLSESQISYAPYLGHEVK